jgi:hypothetical protein
MHENADLKDRTQHLEHVILQLQSETETIGKKQKNLFFKSFYLFLKQVITFIYINNNVNNFKDVIKKKMIILHN